MWDRYGNYLIGIQCIVEMCEFVIVAMNGNVVVNSCECLNSGMYCGVYGRFMES